MKTFLPGTWSSNPSQPPEIPEWYRKSRLSDPAFEKAVRDEDDLARDRIEKTFKYTGPDDLQHVSVDAFAKTFFLSTVPKPDRIKRLAELEKNPSVPRGERDVSLLFYHALENCLQVFSRRFAPNNVADLENKPFFITTVYPFVYALQQRSQRPDRSLDFLDSPAPTTYAEKWGNWALTYYDLDNPDWKQRTDPPAVEYAAENAVESATAFLRELYMELHPIRQRIKHIFREVSAMVLPITFECDGITKAIASPRAQLIINQSLDGLEELNDIDQPTLDEACETVSILNDLATKLSDRDDPDDVAIRKYISSRAQGFANSAPRYCLLPVFSYPKFLPIDPLCMDFANISATPPDQHAAQEDQSPTQPNQNQDIPGALTSIQEGQSELDRAARYFIRRISQVMGLEQGVLESQFKAEVSQIRYYLRKVESAHSLEGLIGAKQNLESRLLDFERARADWGPNFDWDGQRTVFFDNIFDDLAKLLGETAKSEDKPNPPVLTYSEPMTPPNVEPVPPTLTVIELADFIQHFTKGAGENNFPTRNDLDTFTESVVGESVCYDGSGRGKCLAHYIREHQKTEPETVFRLCKALLELDLKRNPIKEDSPAQNPFNSLPDWQREANQLRKTLLSSIQAAESRAVEQAKKNAEDKIREAEEAERRERKYQEQLKAGTLQWWQVRTEDRDKFPKTPAPATPPAPSPATPPATPPAQPATPPAPPQSDPAVLKVLQSMDRNLRKMVPDVHKAAGAAISIDGKIPEPPPEPDETFDERDGTVWTKERLAKYGIDLHPAVSSYQYPENIVCHGKSYDIGRRADARWEVVFKLIHLKAEEWTNDLPDKWQNRFPEKDAPSAFEFWKECIERDTEQGRGYRLKP